jgi:hypothetical protein
MHGPYNIKFLESVCKNGGTEVNNAVWITKAISTVNPCNVACRKLWLSVPSRGQGHNQPLTSIAARRYNSEQEISLTL